MTIKCGNCHQYHESTDDVRHCYGGETVMTVEQEVVKADWPPSEAQIKYVLGLQQERELPDEYTLETMESLAAMDKAEVSRKIQELKVLPYKAPKGAKSQWSMPAGRYAIMEGTAWKFYQVDDGKGRWDGYKFLVMLVGSPGTYQKVKLGTVKRNEVMRLIEQDPKAAMEAYGKESGVCGRCASPLTDPQSLALGIGPKCRAKSGWY